MWAKERSVLTVTKPKPDSETIRKYALAAYQGTQRSYQYLQDHVIPVLQSMLSRTEYEESLVGAYYRSHLLMRSLVKLDHPDDFQAVRSLARSMFELLLDMKSLQRDPALSKRYSSFPMIERMRTAIQVADFVAAHLSTALNTKYKHQIALAGDTNTLQECEDTLRDVFGITTNISADRARRFPKSWSRSDIKTQATRSGLEDEENYVAEYPVGSWFVHGGFVGMQGITFDGFVNAYGRGHLLAQKSCHGSTFIIGKELKLFDAQIDLWTNLKELQSLPGKLFNRFM